MIKLVNLFFCFILINNYCQSKRLYNDESIYQDKSTYQVNFKQNLKRTSNDLTKEYDEREFFRKSFPDFRTKSIDLDTSASSNDLNLVEAPVYFENIESAKKQEQRFSNWFNIDEKTNQTSSSNKLESNLINTNIFSNNSKSIKSNQVKSTKNKKKWRLVSSSTLSDTSLDDGGFNKTTIVIKSIKPKKQRRKSKKLKTANLELKLKETNNDDYVKNRIANTSVYTLNRKDEMKFKLDDAIDYRNFEFDSGRIKSKNLQFNNDTFNKRTQLSGESSKISKKIMLATMLPTMIKGLTSAHSHLAVLPTAAIAQPVQQIVPQPIVMPIQPPVIQVVAPQPRPVFQHVVERPVPVSIVQQPIIQQPRPVIHVVAPQPRPVIHLVAAQPRPIVQQVAIRQPQIYQSVTLPGDGIQLPQDCNPPPIGIPPIAIPDDSSEESIADSLDDDNSSQEEGDAFTQNSWGNVQPQAQQFVIPAPLPQPQQIVIPAPLPQQPQQRDSWGNQPQNQKIYHYQTASVPKKTQTVYTQTKMIPTITSVHSTTSFTPVQKHMIVETEHNIRPVMSLVGTTQRRIVNRPIRIVKTMPQQIIQPQSHYVSNNQGSSWSTSSNSVSNGNNNNYK